MPEDQPVRAVEKVVALLLVTVWSLVFLGLSFEMVDATEPRFWGVFSAIVFVLVGKLWDLEVQKYLPGTHTQRPGTDGGTDTDTDAETETETDTDTDTDATAGDTK